MVMCAVGLCSKPPNGLKEHGLKRIRSRGFGINGTSVEVASLHDVRAYNDSPN